MKLNKNELFLKLKKKGTFVFKFFLILPVLIINVINAAEDTAKSSYDKASADALLISETRKANLKLQSCIATANKETDSNCEVKNIKEVDKDTGKKVQTNAYELNAKKKCSVKATEKILACASDSNKNASAVEGKICTEQKKEFNTAYSKLISSCGSTGLKNCTKESSDIRSCNACLSGDEEELCGSSDDFGSIVGQAFGGAGKFSQGILGNQSNNYKLIQAEEKKINACSAFAGVNLKELKSEIKDYKEQKIQVESEIKDKEEEYQAALQSGKTLAENRRRQIQDAKNKADRARNSVIENARQQNNDKLIQSDEIKKLVSLIEEEIEALQTEKDGFEAEYLSGVAAYLDGCRATARAAILEARTLQRAKAANSRDSRDSAGSLFKEKNKITREQLHMRNVYEQCANSNSEEYRAAIRNLALIRGVARRANERKVRALNKRRRTELEKHLSLVSGGDDLDSARKELVKIDQDLQEKLVDIDNEYKLKVESANIGITRLRGSFAALKDRLRVLQTDIRENDYLYGIKASKASVGDVDPTKINDAFNDHGVALTNAEGVLSSCKCPPISGYQCFEEETHSGLSFSAAACKKAFDLLSAGESFIDDNCSSVSGNGSAFDRGTE